MFAKDNTEDKFLFSFPKGKEKFKVEVEREGKVDEEGRVKGWKELSEDIIALAKEIKEPAPGRIGSAHRHHLIEGWFTAIGCLLAPESDLPEDVIKNLRAKEHFKEIFSQPPVCNRIRELRTRSAVLFFDNYALSELVNLFNPRFKSEFWLWSDKAPKDGDSKHWINQINDHLLCPYCEDIFMQSILEPASKEKQIGRLIEMMVSNKCVGTSRQL